jgi:hypothetical protein
LGFLTDPVQREGASMLVRGAGGAVRPEVLGEVAKIGAGAAGADGLLSLFDD